MEWKVVYRTSLLVDSMAVLLNPKGETISQDEDPDSTIESFDYLLPNYHTSLDACAEFEKDIEIGYWGLLHQITTQSKPIDVVIHHCTLMCCACVGKATPLQRCEAFLRLHGK